MRLSILHNVDYETDIFPNVAPFYKTSLVLECLECYAP